MWKSGCMSNILMTRPLWRAPTLQPFMHSTSFPWILTQRKAALWRRQVAVLCVRTAFALPADALLTPHQVVSEDAAALVQGRVTQTPARFDLFQVWNCGPPRFCCVFFLVFVDVLRCSFRLSGLLRIMSFMLIICSLYAMITKSKAVMHDFLPDHHL